MNLIISISIILVSCVLGAYGALLMKMGSDRLKFRFKSIIKNKHLIGGVFLYGVATVLYILALKGGELSILYPLVSLTYVFTIIFSQRILGEKMNKYKWIGIVLILIGVSLIGIGR